MKTVEIWNLWKDVLADSRYKDYLTLADYRYKEYLVIDPEDSWKESLKKLCSFIDKNKKTPSHHSKVPEEKTLGSWLCRQKKNYNSESAEKSKNGMKTVEIWNLWKDTLADYRYKEYLVIDPEDSWKESLKKLCSFIDKNKKTPSHHSKVPEEKTLGSWLCRQKKNYNSESAEKSKNGMKTVEIWNLWKDVLADSRYKEALKPGNRTKITKPIEQPSQPEPEPKKKRLIRKTVSTAPKSMTYIEKPVQPEPELKNKRLIRKKPVSPEPETKSNDKKIVEKVVEEPVIIIKDIDESIKKVIRRTHILPNKSEVIKGDSEKSNPNRKNSEYQEISRKWSSQKSTTTEKYLAEHPEEWIAYHDARDVSFEGYIQSELPRNRIIANLEKKSKHKLRILDLGCGRNYIAKHFTNHTKIKVIGYDHAIEEGSEARLGNIVNLQDKECDEGADICIYSQSLMGTDKLEYLNEGYRLLRYNGEMIISESVEMLDEIKSKLLEIGMKIEEIETSDSRWFLLCARKY